MQGMTKRLAGSLAPTLVVATAISAALFAVPATHAESSGTSAARIWTEAMAGRSLDPLTILDRERLPANLGENAERFKASIEKRETERTARIEELEAELDEHLEADELKLAINSAIELESISLQPDALLESERIKDLAERIETRAKKAEQREDWLESHTLFYRLNLLYSDSERYEDDAERLAKRLVLLGTYTPEHLHTLNNQRRIEEGEDELPPFNESTDDWRERLKGVKPVIVLRAILQAQDKHINHESYATMAHGGLESLRLLATTSDLARVFPSLEDEQKRGAFIDFIDRTERKIEKEGDGYGFGETRRLVRRILSTNRGTIDVPENVLIHEFGNGATGELDDFSSIIWPYESEQLQRTTEGNFKGVGIQITLDEQRQLKVVTPLFGTPAYEAGIKAEDYIRKVDGESTQGISVTQAVEQITGKEGTAVTLSIEREGVEGLIDFELERAVIDIHTVRGWERSGPDEEDWQWFIDPERKIGYLRLMEFGKDSQREVRNAITKMKRKGLEGLIVDLRYNRGGLLDEAVDIVGFWEESALVVSQENAEGEVQSESRTSGRNAIADGIPTAVLINGGSASASEIVAGALQDYEDAVIVGERSYGKGSVQVVFSLGGGALFRLTTQYYRLPDGRLIHRGLNKTDEWGVEPDVSVEMLPEQLSDALETRQQADIVQFDEKGNMIPREDRPEPGELITEGIDPQLEAALLLLQSQSASDVPAHVQAPEGANAGG